MYVCMCVCLCVCVYSSFSSPPSFFHEALPRDFNNSRSNSGRAPKQRDKRRSDMQAALLCEAAATPFATSPPPLLTTTSYPVLSSSVLAPPLGAPFRPLVTSARCAAKMKNNPKFNCKWNWGRKGVHNTLKGRHTRTRTLKYPVYTYLHMSPVPRG